MAEPLKDLEAELKICRQRQDFLEALDIYEEIDRNGWSLPRHLVGMGDCYLKLRRRSDAKNAWFRALQLQPDSKEVIARLKSTFTSWEEDFENHRAKPSPASKKGAKQAQASSPASSAGPPAEAPANGELSLDDILDSVPDRGNAESAESEESPAAAAGSAGAGSVESAAAPSSPPAASARRPVPVSARMIDPTMDRYINWPFVFEDVAAARAAKLDRPAHTPLPD